MTPAERLARLAGQIDVTGVIQSTALPPSQGGAPMAHPDLSEHQVLGLASSSDLSTKADSLHVHAPHDHDGTYEPTHAHPYEPTGAVAVHAGLSDPHPGYLTPSEATAAYVGLADPRLTDARTPLTHAHLDADIPAGIARDSEVASAVSAHESAGNPHPTYATDADLTTHAATPHGGAGTWTTVIKTADESKNNLATVADDALLRFTTVANTNYVIRLRAFFLTNATADLKYRLVHGGTTTRVRRLIRRTATTDIAQTLELKTAFDAADVVLSTTGLNPWVEEDVILQVGASGGLFRLQWAQVTSNAGPTTCLEGSYLEYALT